MSLGDEIKAVADDTVRDLQSSLLRAQRQLLKSKVHKDELVAAMYQGAKDAALALGPTTLTVGPPRDPRRKDAEVALWHLTDWQGAKVTTSYNSDVMAERVAIFCDRAERLTEIQRADHPVKECVVMFGGDMIEGLFNFPHQVFEIDATLFGQWVNVSNLIIATIQRALGIYEKVTVVAEWGNHGRIGSKRDVVPKGDNFDRMCYEHSRKMLEHEPRLTWEDCPEDIQRVEIGNYRALLIHGDEVGRNGFASPSTIVQHVNRWRSGSYPWAFRDVYMGHYHTHAEWAMANGMGAVYQTGSTESDNRYAREQLAASAIPSQRVHFVNPGAGRVTSQYKVWLANDPLPTMY